MLNQFDVIVTFCIYHSVSRSMTSNKADEPSYDQIESDGCSAINDQASQSSQPSCQSSSSYGASMKDVLKQPTEVIPSDKILHLYDNLSMRNEVSSSDTKSCEFEAGPPENTRKCTSEISNVLKFETIAQEKRAIIKNLLIISIAHMLLSTAFQSISYLHSNFGIIRNTFGIRTVSN